MSLKTCWVMSYIVVYKVLSKISQCDDNKNLDQINAVRISLLSSSFINWDSEETCQIWEKIRIVTKLHYHLASFFSKAWSREGSENSKELIHRAKRDTVRIPILPKPSEIHRLSSRGLEHLGLREKRNFPGRRGVFCDSGCHAAVCMYI